MSPDAARRDVLALVGPTAVGKTDVALELARRLPVRLISMDSAMVYRGLDVGTAKPSRALLARYPHALVDVRDPAERYTTADFVADADAEVRAAFAAGQVPLLVGGTMLYLRSFRDGLADLPPADPAVRAALAREAAEQGAAALHEELRRVDPAAAAGMHPNNLHRVQRALEVYRLTGRPISAGWAAAGPQDAGARLGARLIQVAVLPDRREDLHRRIEQRFAAMLDQGLVDEVRRLRARADLSLDLPSMRAVGYRQVWEHLDGRYGLDRLIERGAAATRQLAKRQLTWLRGWPGLVPIRWGEPDALATQILHQCQLEKA